MGGSISFKDNVPRGTVMTIRIPTNRSPAGDVQSLEVQELDVDASLKAAAAAAASRQQFEALLQSKRILVSFVFYLRTTCSALLRTRQCSAAY
jgi:hypothetical protein